MKRLGTGAIARAGLCAAVSLCACSKTIPPDHPAPAIGEAFGHDLLDRVQQRFVDERGRVDYAALQADASDLDAYYGLLSRYSPDSHPQLFADDDSRLAYWINAYNAAVLKAVITHYPIASVSDVSGPPLSSWVSDQSGFFYFQKLVFGDRAINLYNLEHDVIRKRFPDPRIHFAINCASLGCPKLPRRAFTTAGLHQELAHETRRFLNEERNVRVDDDEGVVHLSSILKWYEDDFMDWYRSQHPEADRPGLLDYVRPYLTDARQQALARAEAAGYHLRFVDYDWRLNDQAAAY